MKKEDAFKCTEIHFKAPRIAANTFIKTDLNFAYEHSSNEILAEDLE